MLPPKLSGEICSLTPDADRLAVSVVFHVNPLTGVVTDGDTWLGKSIIKSKGKLSLSQIDAALTGDGGFSHDHVQVKDIQILSVSSHSDNGLLAP